MGFVTRTISNKIRRPCPMRGCNDGKIPVTKTTKVRGWETKPRKFVVKIKCPVCRGKSYIL